MAEQERPPSGGQIAQSRSNATETGRVNQKLRTRQALVDAARELLASGVNPTLAEVADRALISKTTAYRYFASAEALIEEVFFDREFPTTTEALGSAGTDPTTRVLAVEEAVNGALLAHERAMRVIVRNALDTALSSGDGGATRLGRRRELIAAALEPLAGVLDRDALQRLGHALTLAIGPEAIIAARDICGLDPQETRKVTRWAARALVERARADAKKRA